MFKSYKTYKWKEIQQAREEGQRAYEHGMGEAANPYRKDENGGGLWEQWLFGYGYAKYKREQEIERIQREKEKQEREAKEREEIKKRLEEYDKAELKRLKQNKME